MAKKSVVKRNLKRQKMSSHHKIKREALKEICDNDNLSLQDRMIAQTKLSQLPRDGSLSRVRNRCALTGRPRGKSVTAKLKGRPPGSRANLSKQVIK